ncbi:class F sortase [Planococcus salinus]|uniref:Class F sortase n=1 Tax=Planococcus salinus TaxID=1848460 RepID=A0A3M8P311_9BACL|nr:class F sortase [Planococcus salinus]RNF38125.1 class F sortase [Planococcus salinus]
MAGCQAEADEVSLRTKEIGFVEEQPQKPQSPTMNKNAAAAENPINALKQVKGIKPKTISIPAIGVEAEVLHLGVTENGEMDVPDTIEDVSWFEPGYEPGENGRAVLAGHVDGAEGPAVFWDLNDLKAGDEIIIEGDEGTRSFKVYAMESVGLDLADVDAVFGYRSTPELILITCSGDFDHKRGTREERLIVYTKLVEK